MSAARRSGERGRPPIYPNTPTELRKDKRAWFYQGTRGLIIVAQLWHEKGGYQGTTLTDIPWKTLRSLVEKHRRIERRRKGTAR
jgi:hypothetical protein